MMVKRRNGGLKRWCHWLFKCSHRVNRLTIRNFNDDLPGIRKRSGAPEHCSRCESCNSFHKPTDDLCALLVGPPRKVVVHLINVDHHRQIEYACSQFTRTDVCTSSLTSLAVQQLILR